MTPKTKINLSAEVKGQKQHQLRTEQQLSRAEQQLNLAEMPSFPVNNSMPSPFPRTMPHRDHNLQLLPYVTAT
jgi:hypothetical protein